MTLPGAIPEPDSPCLQDEAIDLLASAAPLPPDLRILRTHIDACPACAGRLRAARADAALLEEILELGEEESPRQSPKEFASDLARYRLLRKIGEGGMGLVYEAEQENPRRRVALKMLRPGVLDPKRLARFELEAGTLARLDHEGIARIFDAGAFTAAGVRHPFFAMELIEGDTLAGYAARCDLAERLRLFLGIVDAVQHAHQRGVIHRDLKPQNILVTRDGRPKVLDFGVARLAGGERNRAAATRTGQLVGTPAYMSPEQARGDVADTRSDVYALGLILFEILAGSPPYDLSGKPLPEAARIVAEGEIPPLRARCPGISRDLDTICSKALATEPGRRYQTAAALADDLRRHLAREPILARPPSPMERLGLFARRNPALASSLAATAVLAAAGIAAIVVLLLDARDSAQKAQRQQRIAEIEAIDAHAARDWLQELLVQAAPGLSAGAPGTMKDVVELAASRVDDDLKEHGVVRAAIHHTLGRVFQEWGELARARSAFETSLALYEEFPGGARGRIEQLRSSLSSLAHSEGDFRKAEAFARLALSSGTAPRDPKGIYHRATSHRMLGIALYAQGKIADAEQEMRRALDLYRTAQQKGGDIAGTLSTLGTILEGAGRPEEADACYAEALPLFKQSMGDRHPALGPLLGKLAARARSRGDYDEALALSEEALAIQRTAYGEEHESVALSLRDLGDARFDKGDREEGLRMLKESLAMQRRVLGDHPRISQSLNFLAWRLRELGKAEEAETCWKESLDIADRLVGEGHPLALFAANGLQVLYRETGRPELASAAVRRILELAPRDARWAAAMLREASEFRGLELARACSYGEALPLLLASVEGTDTAEAEPDARSRRLLDALVETLRALDRNEEADRYQRLIPPQ